MKKRNKSEDFTSTIHSPLKLKQTITEQLNEIEDLEQRCEDLEIQNYNNTNFITFLEIENEELRDVDTLLLQEDLQKQSKKIISLETQLESCQQYILELENKNLKNQQTKSTKRIEILSFKNLEKYNNPYDNQQKKGQGKLNEDVTEFNIQDSNSSRSQDSNHQDIAHQSCCGTF